MDKKLDRFLNFEKEKQLFKRQYRGIYYWQQIRVAVSLAVLKRDGESSTAIGVRKGVNIFLNLLKGCLYDTINFFNLKKCNILYFDQQSYRHIDKKDIDPYFEFFELEKKYSVLRCFYQCKGEASDYKNKGIGVFLPEIRRTFGLVILKMFPSLFRDRQEDKFIDELVANIRDEFQVDVSAIRYQIRNTIYSYKIYSNYYKHILKRVRPNVIIVVCHYDGRLYPLYSVAKKYKIPVVELEHGLISDHEAYSYGDLTNVGKLLPDYLLTYGEFWHDYIRLPACMKAVAIGNPYLEDRIEKYKHIIPDEKKIVFYSGVPTGRELAKFAIDFYQRYKELGYKVYFKLHPSEYSDWQKKYDMLLECPAIKILDKQEDLYELLSGAKHHVTVASTVLFESAVFNVKRYVKVNENFIHCIQPLVDYGFAEKFQTVDEFKLLLDESAANQINIDNIMWKKKPKENAMKFFEKLMNGSV